MQPYIPYRFAADSEVRPVHHTLPPGAYGPHKLSPLVARIDCSQFHQLNSGYTNALISLAEVAHAICLEIAQHLSGSQCRHRIYPLVIITLHVVVLYIPPTGASLGH